MIWPQKFLAPPLSDGTNDPALLVIVSDLAKILLGLLVLG